VGYTILVVEDISDSREMLRFLLESEGYRVLEAANGIDAVATAQRDQLDAILMDISLPLMDGCQATSRIRASGLLSIPIIACTAHDSSDWRNKAFLAGCTDFLNKPLEFTSLLAMLSHYLKLEQPAVSGLPIRPIKTLIRSDRGTDMRLADFILGNMETILGEWEEFAGTLLPATAGMTSLALRDHAKQILEAVAKDLSGTQTRYSQAEKSKGRAPKIAGAPETAAQTHAILRARSGFDINQLVAEYRALRASVLSLWTDASDPAEIILDDVVRFNEAIDQAIVESIAFFSAQVDQARNLLLGMLGHDMRSPLNTIVMTAQYLARSNAGENVSDAASRLIRSGASMKALLDDLIDFNRTTLGLGIKIDLADGDSSALVSDEVEQLRGAHPSRQIELEIQGDTRGLWDGVRLQQLVRNLVVNAINYGGADTPIHVMLTGDEAEITIEVKNGGPAIEKEVLKQIFDPLKRGLGQDNRNDSGAGLGLGLYIVREVARAHGGEVTVHSENGETVFAVRLPRRN
jgi:signal transduction histidine kinase/CheY-like chemotaxis protein